MRISDWSSDVCSSDLGGGGGAGGGGGSAPPKLNVSVPSSECERKRVETSRPVWSTRSRLSALKKRYFRPTSMLSLSGARTPAIACQAKPVRSEEHTSELQSLMRISYAVFCLKKKKKS